MLGASYALLEMLPFFKISKPSLPVFAKFTEVESNREIVQGKKERYVLNTFKL